jgi:hypothetical protein
MITTLRSQKNARKFKMKTSLKLAVIFMLLNSVACNSTRAIMDTGPLLDNEQTLGATFGQGSGVLLLGFIPIGQNDRFQTAYDDAVSNIPGATRLINVSIREKWFYAVILNGFRFRVQGTAVGPK